VEGLDLGANNIVALLLTAPTYFTAAIVSLVVARFSDRKKERGYHIAAGLLAAALGFIITIATDVVPARYAASFLYAPGAFSANALIYSWAVSSLGSTPEKRAAAGAIVNVTGHIGNIVSPYFFRAEERPTYRLAFILMLLFAASSFAMAVTVKWYLKLQNKKIRKHAEESGDAYSPYTL